MFLNDNKKLNEFSRRYITPENMKIFILIVPLSLLLFSELESGNFNIQNFINLSILVSFAIVVLSASIAKVLSSFIISRTEDAMKLTEDYSLLVKRYPKENFNMIRMVKEIKVKTPYEIWQAKKKSNKEYSHENNQCDDEEFITYPVTLLAKRSSQDPTFNFNIIHDHSNNKYELPTQIKDNSDILFKAHEYSALYNSMNIRLDDFKCNHENIALLYSKTTYFDSLLTNRALDFPFKGLRTIREIYEPGPYFSSLLESKMSNHLGFNGFVELNDGSIIFIYRDKHVSISKSKWGTSIGASLKVKDALNDQLQLTIQGLSNAIRKEIKRELKIDVPNNIDLTSNIFAFYRDLVEGGKPQFLFYYKAYDIESKQDFLKNFNMSRKSGHTKGDDKIMNEDGTTFCFLTYQTLKQSEKGIDYLKTKDGRILRMVPSALASIALYLEFKSSK